MTSSSSQTSTSAQAGRRSRERWIAVSLAIQAVLLVGGGWLAFRHFDVDGPQGVAGSAIDFALLGAIAALILAVTGLTMWRMMRRHDRDMEVIQRGLEDQVRRRVNQATGIRDALITGLARLADYRDTDTGTHLDRIAEYSAIIAKELAIGVTTIDEEWVAMLRVASSMHDIGKVGIADAVLLKPSSLTPEERLQIQEHPVIGSDTLLAVRERMGHDPLIEMCIRVTLYHHERWDGAGYPMKLAGDQIPLEARIVSLADVYDALTTQRVYKPAMTHEKAVDTIRQGTGTQFDPSLIEAFMRIEKAFDAARQRLHTTKK